MEINLISAILMAPLQVPNENCYTIIYKQLATDYIFTLKKYCQVICFTSRIPELNIFVCPPSNAFSQQRNFHGLRGIVVIMNKRQCI